MHRPTYGPSRKKRPAETTLLTAEMTLITYSRVRGRVRLGLGFG